MPPARQFRPGFRFSGFDAVILLAGALGAWLVSSQAPAFALVIGIVVGHFFLFCNVFRIPRRPELIWAAVFLGLALPTLTTGLPSWPVTLLLTLSTSATLIALETRRPSYHGIGWKRFNPGLREWWEAQDGHW
jgi:hypothetical protein